MLNQTNARAVVGHVIDPIASSLVKAGVSPDTVTIVGTVGVSLSALIFFPGGHFIAGVLIIMLFIFSDMIDGAMARMSGRSGPWGAFLDSTLDRVADGFVFGSILIWAARSQSNWTVAAALICLVGGALISYAKARAEGLGLDCNVGIAERTERLILILLAAFVAGFGVPYVLPAALWLLAALTVVTVYQRIAHVRRQIPPAPKPAETAVPKPPADVPEPPATRTPAPPPTPSAAPPPTPAAATVPEPPATVPESPATPDHGSVEAAPPVVEAPDTATRGGTQSTMPIPTMPSDGVPEPEHTIPAPAASDGQVDDAGTPAANSPDTAGTARPPASSRTNSQE